MPGRFLRDTRDLVQKSARRMALLTGFLFTLGVGGAVMLMAAGYLFLLETHPPHMAALYMSGCLFAVAAAVYGLFSLSWGDDKDRHEEKLTGTSHKWQQQGVEELAAILLSYTRRNALPAHLVAFAVGFLSSVYPDVMRLLLGVLNGEAEKERESK